MSSTPGSAPFPPNPSPSSPFARPERPAGDPPGAGPGPQWPDAGPRPPAAPPSRAWGITGIVLGGLALLLSWVPIINTLAFVLGLAGLILGIVGLVLAVRRRGPRALSVIALVLSALSLVIVLATQAFYGAVLDEVADSLEAPPATSASAPAEQVAETDEAAGAAGDAEASGGAGSTEASEEASASGALAPGEQAVVGRYTVTVEEVDLDATEEVLALNQFNEAPENGAYATVELTVTYEGEDEGMPIMDLGVELLGADQRNYGTYGCFASTGDVEEQMQGLRTGGTSTYTECFDVPVAATENAQIRVEDQLDFGSEPAVWATR